jgi:hypothetical protein
MSALSARINKLAARIPDPPPMAEERKPVDWGALIAKINAESARVEALPPAQKVVHIRAKIAATISKAESPLPPERPGCASGLAAKLRNLHVKSVKDGFHSEYHEIRRCEIELLRQNGYDITQLATAHEKYVNVPGHWIPQDNPLPPDAQALVDVQLFAL